MFCDKCQIEVELISDDWNNMRCPNCKQILIAPSNSSVDSDDKDSSEKTDEKSKSVSPIYTDYLKRTHKFQGRNKGKIFKKFLNFFKFSF